MTKVFPDEPSLTIDAPPTFERNQKLSNCPVCSRPNPRVDFHLPVEGKSVTTYTCTDDEDNLLHSFAAHHNRFHDADHLKIFIHEKPKYYNWICDNCFAVYLVETRYCRVCHKVGEMRREDRLVLQNG